MALDDYYRAQQDVNLYESRVTSYQIKVANIQNELASSSDPAARANLEKKLTSAQEGLTNATADLGTARIQVETALNDTKSDPTTTVKSPEATNEPKTNKETSAKNADGTNVPAAPQGSTQTNSSDTQYAKKGVSAQGNNPTPVSARWAGVKDLRTTLRVPTSYLESPLTGRLKALSGILFPYTPTISYESQASYGSVTPTHSNYTQHFFKNSSVGAITLSGKFTVQNQDEAEIWLSIIHLGRSLTKMRFGNEQFAGSAPPVCRLDAYGDYVLANVPVSVTSFKFELPDSVDYISVSRAPFSNSMAPTISTISFTLIPMYSRSEIRDFTVDGFLKGKYKGVGYL
jgi:hypothetical protein